MKTSVERRLRRALRGAFFVGAVAVGALCVPVETKAADFGISLNFGRGSFFYATDPGPIYLAPPPPPPRYYVPPPRYYYVPARPYVAPPRAVPAPRPGGPRPGGPRF